MRIKGLSMYKYAIKQISRSVLMTVILFILNSSNNSVVYAETILFEDDFSNGFEKWESVRNNFNFWSIINNQADVFINKGSTLAELVPKDTYWNPDWKNIVYELDYKYIQGADKNISFGFKDVYNWYEIHFVGNSYFLSHVKGGKVVWDFSGRAILENNVTHRISIKLNEGSIITLIDGNEIINVIDPTFDNDYGKIGIKAGAGTIYPTHAIYDNILVKTLDTLDSKLNIILQKQFDPQWASNEYDSAKNWSTGYGIDQWGCLITSLSMIMNFHGIDKMPDGNIVDPSNINLWLKSQPDGYIGSGLVNWMAISRLTKLINLVHSTPNLEYKRISGSNLTTAENEILEGKPVILQIPGHFLVGNGIVENSDTTLHDLYISDPAYNYDKFSEHEKELLSTRTLQPSFTDLSYVHINNSPDINVTIKHEDLSVINNLQTYEEYLSDFIVDENLSVGGFTSNNSPSLIISEIEKPENGIYLIEISQESFGPFDISIFTYNKDGELSNLSYSGLVGKNKIQLKMTYDNQGSSSLEKLVNFQSLLNDINELFELKEIKKHYVKVELDKYANYGKESARDSHLRYVSAIQELINWYSSELSETGKLFLNQRLNEIKGIIQG